MTFQVVCSYADTHEGVDQDCEGAVQQHICRSAREGALYRQSCARQPPVVKTLLLCLPKSARALQAIPRERSSDCGGCSKNTATSYLGRTSSSGAALTPPPDGRDLFQSSLSSPAESSPCSPPSSTAHDAGSDSRGNGTLLTRFMKMDTGIALASSKFLPSSTLNARIITLSSSLHFSHLAPT